MIWIALITLLILLVWLAVKLVKWMIQPSQVWNKNGNIYITHGKLTKRDKRKIRNL